MTKFFVGVPFNFRNDKIHAKYHLGIFTFGFLIFLSNLLLNGPRGINIARFDWMNRKEGYRSPFIFIKDNPDAMLQLVVDSTSIMFFVSVLLIHLIFLLETIFWNRTWKELVCSLNYIQNKMNFSENFYRKCRRQCLLALLILLVVRLI